MAQRKPADIYIPPVCVVSATVGCHSTMATSDMHVSRDANIVVQSEATAPCLPTLTRALGLTHYSTIQSTYRPNITSPSIANTPTHAALITRRVAPVIGHDMQSPSSPSPKSTDLRS